MQTTSGRFGRYELLEQIGAGGMGEVFRARDHDLHRDVAIKFLPERFASDSDRLARFAQEARTASSLNHPNIVTIHEIGKREGRPYLVMELVDGETLRHIIQRRALLPAKQVLEIGAQLADGLAKAHAARVVHRDLKPENVMITKDGFAKILDFGLAKLRAEAEDPVTSTRQDPEETVTEISPNTAVGVLLGTAGYMAPEQVRGLPADYRSDQFALGAMLYELATGHKAFARASVVQTLSAIIEDEVRPIAELNPSFPAPARWAIERCLSKEPENRYASTLDLAHELRGIRERIGEATTSGIDAGMVTPVRRSRWLHLTVAAAVILAVLFLMPAVRDAVRQWTQPAPLAREVRLAVLFDDSALPPADRERLAGLLDYVVIRLADLNRFRDSFSVVPASELREALVRGPHEAKRRVGANLAVSLALHRADRSLVLSATLEDTERQRVLGGDQKSFSADVFSAEDAVALIAAVLRFELKSAERSAWTVGTSGVAEARAVFAKGLAQTPYQIAQSALEKHDQEQSLQTSIEYFNRAIELDPRYADAYAKLGEAYLLLYRLTNRPVHIALAEQNATKGRELDDTRPSTWITLGMIQAQRGALAEAERDLRSAIDRGPRTSIAYRELGRVQMRQGRMDLAEASYRKAVELEPDAWVNYNALGGFLSFSKRFPEAEQAFIAATNKAPDNARVWSNLGGQYYLQGRFDEAERALERANGLYAYGPALSNLATIKFRVRRNYAEAARISERAVKASPRDYRVWQNLAAAYYWAPGERDRAADAQKSAIAILEEARQIEPDNADLIARLADGHAMLREDQQARALMARALKLAPSDRDVAQTAAGVYETLGDRDAALQQVAAALKAGVAPFEFESGPTFAQLVKDPRYRRLTQPR